MEIFRVWKMTLPFSSGGSFSQLLDFELSASVSEQICNLVSLNIDEWDQNKKNSVKLTLASSCLFSEVEPAPFLWNIKNMNKKHTELDIFFKWMGYKVEYIM